MTSMYRITPPLPVLSLTLLFAGCDTAPPVDPTYAEFDEDEDEDEDEDTESTGDFEDGGSSEGGAVEDDELTQPLDPQAVLSGWVGGMGGGEAWLDCPTNYSAIGVAASSTGSYVRQLGLVCGPNTSIEAGQAVPTSLQWVAATGYYNPGVAGYGAALVAGHEMPRIAWDASTYTTIGYRRYRAPNTQVRLCDTGYKLDAIYADAGTYVDRIDEVRCWWDGPGVGPRGTIYMMDVGVGGSGGLPDSSSCWINGGPFVRGMRASYAYWLDGFAVDCTP